MLRCRELADSLHDRILKAMLAAVEAAADSDAKHGQRLRLENYYFLLHSLQAGRSAATLASC